MAKMELFAGKKQVPLDANLLIMGKEETGDLEIYVTISTGGPPFGKIPSIKPFEMTDGDLYGSVLRDILQHELDHGGDNFANTNDSLESQSQEAQFTAFFLEEFAAKFHQKAMNLKARMRTRERN